MKLRAALRQIRPGHWAKNAFVLAPLLFSKRLDEWSGIVDAVAATIVFSLVASCVYVINDWRDRESDAQHPLKRDRPLASGALDGRDAVLIVVALIVLAAAVGIAAGLPLAFYGVVAIYVAINIAYSFGLRHVDLVDIIVIAAGFVLRVLAGTTALDVTASDFIVLSTGLLALLLGLGKRRMDLALETAEDRRSLAGYSVEFIDAALATLAASTIAFYSLFTVSDYAVERYGSHDLYLTTFFVVVGILRYLQVVLNDGPRRTPTEIALSDRFMQVVVGLWTVFFYILAYHT
ncbi:MAG TPA: UbiA prenyltransferase family protein [Baekduia sp.]